MIQQILTTSFKQQLLQAGHNFLTDTFKIALYYNEATLNSATTAYTSAFEVAGTGYTTGGKTVTPTTPASYGTVGYVNFSTVTWTSADFFARGALIYNSSSVLYPNASVMVIDFGMNRYTLQDGTFAITFPTNNSQLALIRIT